jgi:uncharacterized SAM-binding protein YcdF (DUF218 family)
MADRSPTPGAQWPALRWACAIASAVLLADGLVLMALGYFSMGVTVPAALGAAGTWLAWRWHRVQAWRGRTALRLGLWRAGWALLLLWAVSVAAFWWALARQIEQAESATNRMAPQVILVLGSGTPQGQPSPALRARLDKAHELAQAHPEAWVVVSGGVDFGETLSEGQVMGNYLRAQGLDARRILQEERSTSTELNLRYSLPLLQAQGLGPEAAVAVVTSDFHTVRAQRIARKVGYTRTLPVAAPTPLYIRYNAWLREYFAMASSWLLREL